MEEQKEVNMNVKPQDVLNELLQNEKVQEAIKKHKLSAEQQMQAIPVLIDIRNEAKQPNKEFYTDLEITEQGTVEAVMVVNKEHPNHIKRNIKTQEIEEFNLDIAKEQVYPSAERNQVLAQINAYWSGDKKETGIYLFGDAGVGKTFLAKKMLIQLAAKDKEVGFINMNNFNMVLKSSFGRGDKTLNLFNTLKNVDYLLVDDVGSETVTPWLRDDFLLPLLSKREEDRKTTFFTSNYSLEELKRVEAKTSGSKYLDYDKGKRLVERIAGLARPAELKGINDINLPKESEPQKPKPQSRGR